MGEQTKNMLIGIFVVAAFLTPPDAISQCIMAIPMYLLYEGSIWIAKLVEKKREEEEAAYEAELDASLTPKPAAAAAAGAAVATVDETDFNLTR